MFCLVIHACGNKSQESLPTHALRMRKRQAFPIDKQLNTVNRYTTMNLKFEKTD